MNPTRTLETEFKGLSIRIEFTPYESEPQTQTYPGSDAYLEIESVYVEIPTDLVELLQSELEEICWEDLRESQLAKAEALAQDYLEGRLQ